MRLVVMRFYPDKFMNQLLSKLSFCLLLILPTISVAEVSSVKPFSAVCTDVHVAAYRYELDLEGKVTSDEWSEGEKFGSKWKIIYTGDDSVVVDDEKLPVVALNGPSIIFASPEKWTPKIGQRDKCCLGSCCHPGGVLVIHTVRRFPVKRLMPTFGIVER
ncbi:MAG: hypothetical protein K8F53_01410, partial [Rhodocyclaceae bacterium]|nr:hypothetical protein [Rhodocyclaceae bacterium]